MYPLVGDYGGPRGAYGLEIAGGAGEAPGRISNVRTDVRKGSQLWNSPAGTLSQVPPQQPPPWALPAPPWQTRAPLPPTPRATPRPTSRPRGASSTWPTSTGSALRPKSPMPISSRPARPTCSSLAVATPAWLPLPRHLTSASTSRSARRPVFWAPRATGTACATPRSARKPARKPTPCSCSTSSPVMPTAR